MPIYEFICNLCNEQTELMISFEESKKVINCPRCAGGQLIKLLSKPAIHFKGPGFYSTGG